MNFDTVEEIGKIEPADTLNSCNLIRLAHQWSKIRVCYPPMSQKSCGCVCFDTWHAFVDFQDKLPEETSVVFVASTTGQGEAPSNMKVRFQGKMGEGVWIVLERPIITCHA